MGVGGGGETITCIFIDKYLGGGWSALALTLIIGLEVWRGVLFAGLFVWVAEAGGGSCGIVVFEGGVGPGRNGRKSCISSC